MTRPRGEIREVMAETIVRLAAERGPVTAREVAAEAKVGFELARYTIKNMVSAGELQVAGRHKPAGETCWHKLYEPAAPEEQPVQAWGGIEALVDVVKGWRPE